MRLICVALLLASTATFARDTRDPILLQQRNPDGSALCAGCTTSGTEVELSASSDATACGSTGLTYTLLLEVRPVGTPFSNTATHSSEPMTKPGCVQKAYPFTRISGLVPGAAYKWQARESASSGSVSGWVAFNGGATAFVTRDTVSPTRLEFTSASQQLTAGSCSARLTVEHQDSSTGTPLAVTINTTVQLSSNSASATSFSDPGCATPISSVTIPMGGMRADFYWRDTTAGASTLFANASSIRPALQDQLVTAGAPVELLLLDVPTGTVAGEPFTFTVWVRDAFQNRVTDYAGTVRVTSTDVKARLPTPYTFEPSNEGIHVFTAALRSTGARTISLQDDARTSLQASRTIDVRPAAAVALELSELPSRLSVGDAALVRVRALDPWDNVDTSYLGTVRFRSTDPDARIPMEYSFTPADQGERVFESAIAFTKAGTFNVVVEDTAKPSIRSTQHSITVDEPAPGVRPCGDEACRYEVGCGCRSPGAGLGPLGLLALMHLWPRRRRGPRPTG